MAAATDLSSSFPLAQDSGPQWGSNGCPEECLASTQHSSKAGTAGKALQVFQPAESLVPARANLQSQVHTLVEVPNHTRSCEASEHLHSCQEPVWYTSEEQWILI